jgi:hypothetical protein
MSRSHETIVNRHPAAETDANLLALLYESVGRSDGWSTFIEALTRSYAGGAGLLAVHDSTMRNGRAEVAAGQTRSDSFALYNQHYVRLNPWIPQLPKRTIGQVTPSEFLLRRADFIKSVFYHEFLRPLRIDSGVGVTVQQDGTRHMLVSVMFPSSTAERDGDTVGRLQRLVPHMMRVAQLNRQLAGIETRAVAAETALDRLATAMLVVGATAQVIHLNAAA